MLQQYVKLSCIPASLLQVVIHPLKVFPPRELLAALLHTGFSRRVDGSVFKSDWWRSPGSTITLETDGVVSWTTESRTHTDMAVARIPAQCHENYEFGWSFEIRENDATAIDVGFICVPGGNYELVNDIVKKSLEDFSETRFLRINTKEKKLSMRSRDEPVTDQGSWNHCETTAEENFKIDFHFNTAVFSSCDTYVGDSHEGYIFPTLPGEEYLPVICLNGCLSGEVQFKLIRGFDFY